MTRSAEQIFHTARERPTAERAAYLDGACGNDVILRDQVEALLKADAEAGSFLKSAGHARADPDATMPQAVRAAHRDQWS